MRRALVPVAILLATGCGRIGFDPEGTARVDAGPDTAVIGQLPLGRGANARYVIAPEGSLTRLYVVLGDNRIVTSTDGGTTLRDCGSVTGNVNGIAGSSTGSVFVASSRGVFLSTDRCATFANAGFGGYAMTVALDGPDLLVGTGSGLRRRTAAGAWQSISSPMNGLPINDIHAGPPYLMASTNGIARSTDGVTWTLSNTGLASNNVLRIAYSPTRIYVSTYDGVHVSTDGGLSWIQRFTGYGDALAVDPGDPMFALHTWFSGLIASSDGGGSWSTDRRPPDAARGRVGDILFDPTGSGRVVIATSRGLFAADDHGLALTQIGDLDGWTVFGIATAASGSRFYATPSGVLRDRPGSGLDLLDPGGPDISSTLRVIAPGDRSRIYVTGRSLVESSDDGETFTEVYEPAAADNYVTVAIARDGDRLWITTNARVGSSTAGGAWTFQPLGAAEYSNDLLVIPNQPRAIVVATDVGVFASTDGGATFALSVGIPGEGVALAEAPDGSVLAATYQGLFRAPTPGATFVRVSATTASYTALLVVGSTILAGEDDHLSRSTDGGVTFTRMTSFTGHEVRYLTLDATGALMIGTSGYGLHRLELP